MCVVGLRRGARIRPAAWRGVLGVPGLAAAWLSAAGCGERAVTTVHLQGTVRTLGLQMPVTGAEVTVQWPAALGGGESALRTNSAGQYVVERRVRQREVSCAGLAVSHSALISAGLQVRGAGNARMASRVAVMGRERYR